MKASLVAVCGMNCGICYARLRDKNQCPGCRYFYAEKPVSIARCKIRNCDTVKNGKVKYCYTCQDFPCNNLKNLDKRYRNKYRMSEIENLLYIREKGIRKFVENEKKRWTCAGCGGTINVHIQLCSCCGKKAKV